MKSLHEFSLAGKVALITGAGRGIGLSIAKSFVSAGAAVAIQDIDEQIAREAIQPFLDAGAKAIALGGDIGDLDAVRKMVPATVDALGGIHILVNNAGIQSTLSWLEISADLLLDTYRANVVAPIVLAQAAVPIFTEQKWGRVINIGSIQGSRGSSQMIHYSMTKAAIANMSTSLARDLGKFGITANTIAPGWMDTFRNKDGFKDDKDKRDKGKWLPVPRLGVADDVAGTALLLASDAGQYITGQTIHVDGGMSL